MFSETTGRPDAIVVDGLRKTYSKNVEALHELSFRVRAGEVFALLGPNGAGKSTTVRILTTLTTATAGSAQVAGFDVTRQPQEVRRRIGYVGQNSGVDPMVTARENLLLQGKIFRLGPEVLIRRVDELLDLFQLKDDADRIVEKYSGGMRRRLDVAVGLIHQPEVLFLDEPTTGLDPQSRAVMWGEVRRLAKLGLTILVTTHYLEEADQLAQRLAIIDHGRLVVEGSPDELKGRLRGDVVTLELADATRDEGAKAVIEALDGVSRVLGSGAELYAQVNHGASAVLTIVSALKKAGIEVVQIALGRPSLDDVYLHATGHSFKQDGRTPAEEEL